MKSRYSVKRADDGVGADLAGGQRERHLLQALRVVGGEPREHDDADESEHELEAAVLPEDPDERRQHDADEAHEEELPPASQAPARRRAVERQRAEHSGRRS